MNRNAVLYALKQVISDLDYDLHKNLEEDEETGNDGYPELLEEFLEAYDSYEG
jgi:hypothetical protein